MLSKLHTILPKKAVSKYYLYTATTAVGFYSPIIFLFFRDTGLSYTEIALLETAFMVTTFVGEIPTGYVGDRIGWRNSLLVGSALTSLTLFGIGFATSFLGLLALHIIWSLSFNFRSGSESAWLYESLEQTIGSDAYSRVQGRGRAVNLSVGAITAVIGGYLGSIELAVPFFAAGVLTAFGVPVLLTFPVTSTTDRDEFSIRDATDSILNDLLRSRICGFILYYIAFVYLMGVLRIFVQPIAVGAGLTIGTLGWIYGVTNAVSAGANYHTQTIRDKIGIVRWMTITPLFVGVSFLLVYRFPVSVDHIGLE
ncbi:major facilitator superfamily MFS_1 [halophilic archaeon DL31]|jgi:MFS family permease|nr:major facilitator superfamily MFS_1 [halophilic archaeon DL31]